MIWGDKVGQTLLEGKLCIIYLASRVTMHRKFVKSYDRQRTKETWHILCIQLFYAPVDGSIWVSFCAKYKRRYPTFLENFTLSVFTTIYSHLNKKLIQAFSHYSLSSLWKFGPIISRFHCERSSFSDHKFFFSISYFATKTVLLIFFFLFFL